MPKLKLGRAKSAKRPIDFIIERGTQKGDKPPGSKKKIKMAKKKKKPPVKIGGIRG